MSRHVGRIGWLAALLFSCVAQATNWSAQTHDAYPGDFNGDGRDDLLVIARDPAGLSGIFTSSGGQPSVQLQSWNSGFLGINWHSTNFSVVVADFDGNNRDDVLLQRNGSGNSFLLLANSEGKLYAIHQVIADSYLSLGWTQRRIVAGDFNGDGRDELLLQPRQASVNTAIVASNTSGQLTTVTQTWPNNHLGFKWSTGNALVHVGDFNADNRDDLLIQAKADIVMVDYDVPIPIPVYKPQSFGLTLATASGQFTSIQQLWSRKDFGVDWAPGSADVVIGDFNGDNRDDVLLVGRKSGQSSYLLLTNSNGQISSSPVQTLAPGTSGTNWTAAEYRMLAADFTGDGRSELYRQASTPGGTNSIASFTASGTLSAVTTHSAPPISNGLTTAIGRLPGQFTVGANGGAEYEIPLDLPAGTNGLKPSLSFDYNSQSGNGLLGMGWSLAGLSAITLCPKTLDQDNVTEAVGYGGGRYCLDGNKLRTTNSSTYGAHGATYQTEVDVLSRITSYTSGAPGFAPMFGPQYFKVEGKDGLYYFYGWTEQGRIEQGMATISLRTWALDRIEDRNGNYLTITYTKGLAPGGWLNGSFRPTLIEWARTAAGQGPYFKAVLQYESRPDVETGFFAGTSITEDKRLDYVEVQAFENGAWGVVRKYDVTYEGTLSNANHSRLASITQCSASECLPPTTFQYQNGASGWPSSDTFFDSGLTAAMVNAHTIDIDGDARDDLVYPDGGFWRVRLSKGSGYGPVVTSGIATGSGVSAPFQFALPIDYYTDGRRELIVNVPGFTNLQLLRWTGTNLTAVNTNIAYTMVGREWIGEVDGDGRQDFIYGAVSGFVGTLTARLNTGDAGGAFAAAQQIYSYSGASVAWGGFSSFSDHVLDLNGDGRVDFMFVVTFGGGCPEIGCFNQAQWLFAISSPTGYEIGGATPMCTPVPTSCGDVATLGDFNGDGLSDAITSSPDGSGMQWLLSTGTGANGVGATYITLPSTFYGATRRIVDYDHDGRDDILFQQNVPSPTGSWYVLRSNGTGFDTAVATTLPTGSAVNAIRIMDIDGDGQQDIGYRSTSWRVRKHFGSYPDLLTRATDGLGNYVAPVYAPLTDSTVYTKGTSTQYPYADVLTPMYVVKNYAASTGIASPAEYSVTYKYEAGRVQLRGRGFVGFAKRTRTDTRDASPLITVETSRQDFPYIGNPASTITYQSDGVTKISELAYTYDKKDLDTTSANTRVFPFVSQSVETKYEVGAPYNGQAVTRSTTTNTFDNFGNVTGQIQLAEDLHSSSPLNGAQYQTQTVNTVVNDTGANWCIGAITRGELKSKPHGQASFVTRTKSYAIDYAKCRMTQEKVEPDIAALRATTDIVYYANGQVLSRTVTGEGMTPRPTTYEYHAAGPYVTKQTNALSQYVQSEWAVGLGVETARIDINGQRIDWGYDTLGRKINERAPDSTRTDFSYFPCQTGCGYATGRYQIVSIDSAGGVTSAQSASVFDMMGREIQATDWMMGGAQSHVLTEYDAMGRAFRSSAPFFTGGSVYWTTQTYDVIGRPKSETRAVSESDSTPQSTTWDYEGLRTKQTDPLGKIVVRRSNAIGQVVQMTDSANGYTWYEYDAWGNNTKTYMGDASGVLTPGTAVLTQYDLRGRKQNSTDPDMGYWQYAFNPLDELTSQTDAKSQPVTMQYDLLGRMWKRTEAEGITTITFDTATNGKGKIHTISAPSGTVANGYQETRSYDSLGRPTTTTTTVDGTAYAVTFAYNTAGQIDTVEYPQSHPVGYRFKVRYSYDYGQLKQVKDAVAGTVYWTAVDSNPAGEVTSETLGNGIGISSWRDAVSGVLRQRYSGPGYNGTVQALQYQWDRNANLTQRSDTNQGYTENFYYDSLYRLDYSTLTTGSTTVTNLDVTYNAIGNITFMSGVGNYSYAHATKKHAVTATSGGASLPAQSFAYDLNGNIITRAGSTIDWYSYNLPSVLRQGTDSSRFFYGPDRERFKQIAVDGGNTETTIYIGGGLLERVTKPSGVIEYKHNIAGDGAVVASYTRRSNSIYDTRYFTTDHLGSIDTISNESGTILTRLSYDAFGKRRDFTGVAPGVVAAVTHHGFTGHEMLDNVDLIHMNGRVYDPLVARFLSPDPFVAEPYSSQALNRYTYVDNNPLSYTDPSGYSKLSSAWRKLERAVKKFVRKFFAEVVAVFITVACTVATDGAGGPGCVSAGASARQILSQGGRLTPPEPATDPPYIGRAESGVSLPPGTIVFLGVPGSAADVSQPQAEDLMGDPLFATIIDILGGLIPGYDLLKVFNDPNATTMDWVMAIGSTALSVTPFKALTLANKVIKAVKSYRAGRLAAKAARALCCFAAGTEVDTEQGPRPIETLRPGDRVLSRNEETGETAYQPITEVFVNDHDTLWELQIVDATGATETHRVTHNHPYWVVGVGWVQVADLKSGMLLQTAQGAGVNVVSLVDTKRVERTYNLEVANFHTFFAGEQHVLVHNGKCDVTDLTVDYAKSAVQAAKLARQLASQQIARGHAFIKHAVQRGEFPGIRTRAEFAKMVEGVMENATHVRQLGRGRTAFWRKGVVVIRDPNSLDGGTAFVPTDGFKYFEGLL